MHRGGLSLGRVLLNVFDNRCLENLARLFISDLMSSWNSEEAGWRTGMMLLKTASQRAPYCERPSVHLTGFSKNVLCAK